MENGTARGLWFVAPGRVEIREVPLPAPRAGEVRVRTAFSGISAGTELLAYRGQIGDDVALDETLPALAGRFDYPFQYGYSCVGRVEAACAPFEEGEPVFAFHPHQDRFVAAIADIVPLGDIDLRTATLFPLVETALQVSLDADPAPGTFVVVAGLGAVGLLSALLVQSAGARILASDPLPERRALAAALGVDSIAPDDLDVATAGATGGAGAPLVIEATGNPETLASALRLLAHEGTVLVVSWYGTKPVELPLGAEFHRRRLTIRSSQVSTIPARLAPEWSLDRRRRVAQQLLRELPLEALATHSFAFASAAEAFDVLDHPPPGLLHAALCYE
jgi:2-desacetyl-2-hydroxyethyl bacteriochlorophyllide A dehydrogenase